MRRFLTVVTAALVLSLAAMAAGDYSAQQQSRELKPPALALVKDTTDAVRAMLAAPNASTDRLEREAAAAQVREDALRRQEAEPRSVPGQAAYGYVTAAAEIVRRQLEMKRARERLPESTGTLTQYLRADSGAASSQDEAARLKEVVDRDFQNYRIAVEQYLAALRSFAAARSAIQPHVAREWLVGGDAIERAKRNALDTFAAQNHETRLATDLDSHKVQAAASRTPQARGVKGKATAVRQKQGAARTQKSKSGAAQKSKRTATQKPRSTAAQKSKHTAAQKPRATAAQKSKRAAAQKPRTTAAQKPKRGAAQK